MVSAAATGDLVNHLFLTVIVNVIVNIYLNVNVNNSDLKMMTGSRVLVLARMKSNTILFSIL